MHLVNALAVHQAHNQQIATASPANWQDADVRTVARPAKTSAGVTNQRFG
jgi:hypothetical protein